MASCGDFSGWRIGEMNQLDDLNSTLGHTPLACCLDHATSNKEAGQPPGSASLTSVLHFTLPKSSLDASLQYPVNEPILTTMLERLALALIGHPTVFRQITPILFGSLGIFAVRCP